jgi:hypothetical protein
MVDGFTDLTVPRGATSGKEPMMTPERVNLDAE